MLGAPCMFIRSFSASVRYCRSPSMPSIILVPIAVQIGFNPLHYATVLILAMGLGLFSPPIGLGLYATCSICGVSMKEVIRPMFKYWVIVALGLLLVAFIPFLTVWLPRLAT